MAYNCTIVCDIKLLYFMRLKYEKDNFVLPLKTKVCNWLAELDVILTSSLCRVLPILSLCVVALVPYRCVCMGTKLTHPMLKAIVTWSHQGGRKGNS